MQNMVQAHQVNKTFFSGSDAVPVIKDLSLQIDQGEFTVVMGSSGSGKSSLLYLLAGLDRPSTGKIQLMGHAIETMSESELAKLRQHAVGFIFQDFNLIPNLTLLENILIAGYLGPQSKAEVVKRAKDLLELTGIAHLADRLPSRTSGGEQQRCAIARALINQPKVVLADEPTGNLNSATSGQILDIFEQIHASGQTLIMVTHDLKTACCGDRILYMQDGQIMDGLDLPKNEAPSEQTREAKLYQWLTQRGW